MASLFSKIVSGEIPAYKVAESNDYLAFLDVNPLTAGHVLVIPKEETDYIFDMGDDAYMGLWLFAKIIAKGLKAAFPCEKIGVAVVGLEVPHTHIHLIPINSVSDMDFSRPKIRFEKAQFEEHALKIRQALSSEKS